MLRWWFITPVPYHHQISYRFLISISHRNTATKKQHFCKKKFPNLYMSVHLSTTEGLHSTLHGSTRESSRGREVPFGQWSQSEHSNRGIFKFGVRCTFMDWCTGAQWIVLQGSLTVELQGPQFDPELRLLPVWDCLVLHVLPMSVCVSSRISALPPFQKHARWRIGKSE